MGMAAQMAASTPAKARRSQVADRSDRPPSTVNGAPYLRKPWVRIVRPPAAGQTNVNACYGYQGRDRPFGA